MTDWSFVNDIPLCQIQIYAGVIPHAVNLNCMATPEGELFLSCSVCSTKSWASHVGQNEPGRLRLNGRVYPVVLNRVQDEAVLDRAWAARVKKLQVHGEAPTIPPRLPTRNGPRDGGAFSCARPLTSRPGTRRRKAREHRDHWSQQRCWHHPAAPPGRHGRRPRRRLRPIGAGRGRSARFSPNLAARDRLRRSRGTGVRADGSRLRRAPRRHSLREPHIQLSDGQRRRHPGGRGGLQDGWSLSHRAGQRARRGPHIGQSVLELEGPGGAHRRRIGSLGGHHSHADPAGTWRWPGPAPSSTQRRSRRSRCSAAGVTRSGPWMWTI